MVLFITIYTVLRGVQLEFVTGDSEQAHKIPIGPAHLQAAIASLMNVAVSITDDVSESVAATPDSMASSAILGHSI
jgi:hypothetical protein